VRLPLGPKGGMAEALPETLAAVDLGSNSFHMVVARVVRGQPVGVDGARGQVRPAAGQDDPNVFAIIWNPES